MKKIISLLLSIVIIMTLIPTTGISSFAAELQSYTIETNVPIDDDDDPVTPKVLKTIETHNGITIMQKAKWLNEKETKAKATIEIKSASVYEECYHDIVLIADVSSSMNETKLANEKKALYDSINEIEAANVYVQNKLGIKDVNRVALVKFSTDASTVCDFTKDYEKFNEAVDSLTSDGSTNYGAAMAKAQELIDSRTDTSRKATVIFVTDGKASHNIAQAKNIIQSLAQRNIDTYCIQYMFEYKYQNLFKSIYSTLDIDDLTNTTLTATKRALSNITLNDVQITGDFTNECFDSVKFLSATKGNVSVIGNSFIYTVPELSYGEKIEMEFYLDATSCTNTYVPLIKDGLTVQYTGENSSINDHFTETYVLRQNHFSVTYDVNGGEGIVPVDNVLYSKGTCVIAAPAQSISKAGYKFAGWDLTYTFEIANNNVVTTKKSTTLQIIQPGATFKTYGNTTLTAVWTKINLSKTANVQEPVYPVMAPYELDTHEYSQYRALSYVTSDFHNTSIKDKVVSISLLDHIDTEAMESSLAPGPWDVSAAGNNSVMAWMTINNEETAIATTSAGLTEPDDSTKRYNVYIGARDGISANRKSSTLFSNFTALKEINGLENLHMDNVDSVQFMFSGSSSLTSLDLSSWNTSNITDMLSLFSNCYGLESINMSGWDTSNVTNMIYMFYRCKNILSLDLSNFDIHNVTDIYGMFCYCEKIQNIVLGPNFNPCNVSNITNMFYGCSNLLSLDVSNWNTSKVTNMSALFSGCAKLTTLSTENWDLSSVTNMRHSFSNCTNLISIGTENWSVDNVTDMYGLFWGCNSLTDANPSKWNTGNVTSMAYMFSGCSSLNNINVKNFNTEKVTTMYAMFSKCKLLTVIDTSNWKTNSLKDARFIFNDCLGLTSIDLSNWNTSNVYHMGGLFYNCSNLESVNLSNFDVGMLESMDGMFAFCKSLKEIDLSTWKNAIPASCCFKQALTECYSLEKLNLSNWNFSDSYSLINFASKCTKLNDIYLNNVSENNATFVTDESSFFSCSRNTIIHSNVLDLTDMAIWTDALSKIPGVTVSSISVLGANTTMIPVKERDYIIYDVTVQFDGKAGVYSGKINVSDKIPDGLTFIYDHFKENDYANAGIAYGEGNTAFLISKNNLMIGKTNVFTEDNTSKLLTSYPIYDAATNTVSFSVDKLPGGTQLTVSFVCQVNKLNENENGKYFYNTAHYTDEDGNGDDSDTQIHYIPGTDTIYTITYQYTGDVPAGITTIPTLNNYAGSTITLLDEPAMTGYSFSGWTVIDSNNKAIEVTGNSFILNDNVVITGKWTENTKQPKYSVSYSYSGNVPKSAPTLFVFEYEAGETVVLPEPSINGYTFSGWTSDSLHVTGKSFTMPDHDVVFTGHFSELLYKITYTLDGEYYDEYYAPESSQVILPVPTVDKGRVFSGWCSDSTIIHNTYIIMPASDIIVYGDTNNRIYNITYSWTDNTYIPNYIDLITDQAVAGDNYTLLDVKSDDHFRFVGWNVIDENNNKVPITNNIIIMPESDINVIGCWKPYNYTLTADADNISLFVGEQEDINVSIDPTPENSTITWISSNPEIAKVDYDTGKVTGITPGTTTAIGTLVETGDKITIGVTVKLPDYNLKIDGQDTLYIGYDTVLSTSINPEVAPHLENMIVWKSSNDDIISINDDGKITAISEGVAEITATLRIKDADGYAEYSDSKIITVKNYRICISGENNIMLGDTTQLSAAVSPKIADSLDQTITWSSSNTNIAEVDSKTGFVTSKCEGTVTITAALLSTGITTTHVLNVIDYNIDATDITVYVDETKKIDSTITPFTNDPKITYVSADESIAKVDQNGNITGIKVGTTTITLSLPNGKTKTITANVTLDPSKKTSIAFGKTDGIGYYKVSTDNGKTYQTVFGNSTETYIKGTELIIKVVGDDPSYTFYVNESRYDTISTNTIKITVSEYALIRASSVNTPDIEERLSFIQKLINLIKSFFAKIFG